MVVNATISSGEEIFNTYGDKLTNAELLLRYGFALDVNENNVVSWTVPQALEVAAKSLAEVNHDLFEHILSEWTSDPTWDGSNMVVNTAYKGTSGGGSLSLHVTADGAITHSLWVLCALTAYGSGEIGHGADVVQALSQVASAQCQLEQFVEDDVDDEVVDDPLAAMDDFHLAVRFLSRRTCGVASNTEDGNQMLRKTIEVIISICQVRSIRIGDGKGSAAIGEYLDVCTDFVHSTKPGNIS